ncbi:MAG: hypothetical protein OXF85_00510 [Candidatus Saccharibacteria bacterium]|nr:hypothetical protein [Candidatus Saccharibacteria bacterium]MCY4010464.1 hypothetical protein [Candidatus Saccharibacteria bacterium]
MSELYENFNAEHQPADSFMDKFPNLADEEILDMANWYGMLGEHFKALICQSEVINRRQNQATVSLQQAFEMRNQQALSYFED